MKNAQIFVPMLVAHRLDAAAWIVTVAACVAFSLAASSIYMVNDLVDVEADGRHPSKRRRPLAAGTVPILASLPLAGVLALVALAIGAALSWPFVGTTLGFSMFIFTSLALIKRHVELTARIDADLPDPTNRNYRTSDLGVITALAAASGFNAVTVFACGSPRITSAGSIPTPASCGSPVRW